MDFGKIAEDAARGAAAGSVVPGVGTALGVVGGIVLDLAPEVGRWLFGVNAGPAIAAVQDAIGVVTGSQDPSAQAAALMDPEKASALRVELARIAAEQATAAGAISQATLVARLGDVAGARAATLQLAQVGSGMAWGAGIVSVLVLVMFGVVVSIALTHALPPNGGAVLNVLMGTIGAMATSVVSYWVGSSAGSARKDARLASLAERS